MSLRAGLTSIVLLPILALLLTVDAGAQNIITISSASIEPGESFVLDVTMENETLLGGWQMVFRWSSGDIRCDSAVVNSAAFDSRFLAGTPPIDYSERIVTMALVPVPALNLPVIQPGEYPLGQLYFSSDGNAEDQVAFVDSAIFQVLPGIFQHTNLSTADGTSSIIPDVQPGVITIGTPGAVEILVSPATLFFEGTFEGPDPIRKTIAITSATEIEFDWTAQWTNQWLSVSPNNGKSPGFPSVGIDLFALDIGNRLLQLCIGHPRRLGRRLSLRKTSRR